MSLAAPPKAIRLVLVEDELCLLESLRDLFLADEGIVLLAALPTAEEAMDLPWENTDVLLADLSLPGLSGVELIRHAVAHHPGLLAAAYTIHENRSHLFQALAAGASGYVIKGGSAEELTRTVHALAAGQAPISPAVARHLIAEFRDHLPASSQEALLSPRELQILQLLAIGRINKEIADQLFISVHTVHNHLKNIYAKLHAKNRSQALRQAKRHGYLGD